ncbi:MAG: hypothetical protein WB992_19750, partial [Bryobacteraceae bacterium]
MRGLNNKLSSTLLVLPLLAGFSSFCAAATQTGDWILRHSDTPGKIHFSVEGSQGRGHDFSNSSDCNSADFQGLDSSTPAKHDVRFTISRDAGEFVCEGFLRNGEGAGLFTFTPNAQYSHEMEALGFPGVTDEKQIGFALHNVSLAFAREMKGAGIEGLDTDKLLAFR